MISIHAPTRGATSYAAIHCGLTNISIHAPTRGATISFAVGSTLSIFQSTLLQEERRSRSEAWGHVPKFQSTLLQEERHNTDDACTDGLHISIHAPTRGATVFDLNSHHFYLFQSTLLQEERRQKCTIILILICNNYCIVSIKSHQHYNNYFM